MGCNCGSGKRSAPIRGRVRPSAGPVSIQGQRIQAGLSPGNNITPAQIRTLGLQTATSPRQAERMDEQRRRIERLRRNAIKKSLGK